MDKLPDPVMNRGIVAGFSQRKASKGQQRQAQIDKPMDDLFKPEKKPMPEKHGPDADVDIDVEEGLDKDIGIDKKLSFDEIKSGIENFEGSPEELEELCDLCQDKLMGSQHDDIDTEMNRGEAEMKDDMKKDRPLGGAGMGGAQAPMPPATAAPSPMR